MTDIDQPLRGLPLADLAVSDPGAPGEPQRTQLRLAVVDPVQAIPLLAAKSNGYLGQEALEPEFVRIPHRHVVPALVSDGIDMAIVDAAAAVGERVLGWGGVVLAAFGPAAEDRSVSLLVAEPLFCQRRPDTCDRVQRAARRGLAWVARLRDHELYQFATSAGIDAATVTAMRLDDWWADCAPDSIALRAALEWGDVPSTVDLQGWLLWEADPFVAEPGASGPSEG